MKTGMIKVTKNSSLGGSETYINRILMNLSSILLTFFLLESCSPSTLPTLNSPPLTVGYGPNRIAVESTLGVSTSTPPISSLSPTPPPFLLTPAAVSSQMSPALTNQPRPGTREISNTVLSNPAIPINSVKSSPFGLIVTGLEKEPDKPASLKRVLDLSQARWWYQYVPQATLPSPITAGEPTHQIYLLRSSSDGLKGENYQRWAKFIQATGHFDQPTYWLIGNEPNVPGQDNTTPETFAEMLYEANRLIRSADPQATLIGPNILNWDYTCQGCPGYTSGLSWVQKLRQVYNTRYGTGLPFDAWSLHTYNLDWQRLPLINQAQDAHQIEAFRQYLDQSTDSRHKPIWLTEFGVIWGYDSLEWHKDTTGNWQALPKGRLRTDLMESYLASSLDWLEQHSTTLGLGHWFLYTSYGEPEAFSQSFSGISLFDSSSPSAKLTNFGNIYITRLKKSS